MPGGDLRREILVNTVRSDAANGTDNAVSLLRMEYPELSESRCRELAKTMSEAVSTGSDDKVSLVVTTPPTFSIKARPTKITVETMVHNASRSILITGYSLSDYFKDIVDDQTEFDRVLRYKGRFLKVYNYPKQQDDKMAALHAKVISVDKHETLITSANLSYHGQEGNLELGTYIESASIAKQIDDVFTQLIFRKVFVEV